MLLPRPRPRKKINDWRPDDESAMRMRIRFLQAVRAERRRKIRHTKLYRAPVLHGTPRQHDVASTPSSLETALSDSPQPVAAPGPSLFSERLSPVEFGPGPLAPSDGRRIEQPANGCSTNPSRSDESTRPRSLMSVAATSISEGIRSLARSSSSASRKGSSNGRPGSGPVDPLSKSSRSEFLRSFAARFTTLWGPKAPKAELTDEALNRACINICCGAVKLRQLYYTLALGGEGPLVPDNTPPYSPDCVHMRLGRAVSAQSDMKAPGFREFVLTDEEANMVDEFGNKLLHVAARWGARVSLLMTILKRTDGLTWSNGKGETFLHVYDPPSGPLFRASSFLTLVGYLRSRGFDWCQRDVEKRTSLQRLVEKKDFPVEALHGFFQQIPHASARFLVTKRAACGDRLWDGVQRNLKQRAPQLLRVFGDEQEFLRRYLPEFKEGPVPLDARRPRQTQRGGDPNSPGREFSHRPRRNPDAKRTGLMELLRRVGSEGTELEPKAVELESKTAGRKPKPTTDLEALMAAEIPATNPTGYLRKRDKEGNTALHYAAEFGLPNAVRFLCEAFAATNAPPGDGGRRDGLHIINNCGNTPLQLVRHAIQRTDVQSDILMEARYLLCAVALLEAEPADEAGPRPTREASLPWILGGKSTVFDGSEGSVDSRRHRDVAWPCKGLHLLSASQAEGASGPVEIC